MAGCTPSLCSRTFTAGRESIGIAPAFFEAQGEGSKRDGRRERETRTTC